MDGAKRVDEVIMGCVLPAGLGQAPARQAALGAGLPTSAGCTTINKVCGSGMKAVMLGHDLIKAGSAEVVVAGGMESMTNAPHLLNGSRTGIRFGSAEMLDHMAWDGLTNPYDKKPMGSFGELCVGKYGFTRERPGRVRGRIRAPRPGRAGRRRLQATKSPRSPSPAARATWWCDTDEQPGKCDIGKIPTLRPAFKKDGTITAASSSSINDGAAALVLASKPPPRPRAWRRWRRIVAHATHAQAPEWFTTAPVAAIQAVLAKAGWTVADVDLFEVNEAFATVAMAPIKELGIPHAKLNVNGGACALGHPIGASGARLVVTLLHALQARGRQEAWQACVLAAAKPPPSPSNFAEANIFFTFYSQMLDYSDKLS